MGRGDDEPQGRISTPPGSDFVEVVSGHTFNCARRRSGELYCWGSAHELSDAFLRPPAGRFVALTAHRYHACALREDRTATCWGYTPAFVGPEGPPD